MDSELSLSESSTQSSESEEDAWEGEEEEDEEAAEDAKSEGLWRGGGASTSTSWMTSSWRM